MSSYSVSKTQAVEDSKKKTSLLKDNSWIRKTDDEDEPVDKDPNFGKTVLSQVKTNETTGSNAEPESQTTAKPKSSSRSVSALTQRFSGSKEDLKTTTPSYYTKRYSSGNTDTSYTTKTTTVTKEPTTETTITTAQSVKSTVSKSTKTETFTERVKSSSKGSQYSSYSPTKTTKPTITSTNDADDQLFNSLTPATQKDDSQTSNKTVITNESVTVKTNSDPKNYTKTTTPTTKASTTPVDDLYGSLLPKAITSPDSKKPAITVDSVTVKSITDPKNDTKTTPPTTKASTTPVDDLYGSLLPKAITSPDSKKPAITVDSVTVKSITDPKNISKTTPTTTKASTTPVDDLYGSLLPKAITSPVSSNFTEDCITTTSWKGDESPSTLFSKRSYGSYSDDNPYSSSYSSDYKTRSRPVLEKDLCTHCRKPFTGDAKMVLDDMKINCHASCFKCDICNGSLSYMKAGDSIWLYKRKVHCENCFENTRDKWRR